MKYILIFTLSLAAASPSCGNKTEGRVYWGQLAIKGQFPYQVGISGLLRSHAPNWCGGTLISNSMVLTAAHCTYNAVKAIIYLGTTDIEHPEVTHVVYRGAFINHRRFNPQTLDNDISLIKIPHTSYNHNIQAVRLPKYSKNPELYTDKKAVVVGWGPCNPTHPKFEINLHWGYMHIVNNEKAIQYFGHLGTKYIKPSNICAFSPQCVSVTGCDSGGPLVLANTNLQIGLTSKGVANECHKGHPAIFTRINSYLRWIKKHAKV